MWNVVSNGEQEDGSDSIPRQRQTAVSRRMVRLADGHVAVGRDEDGEPNRRRLAYEDERVRIQADVVPADGAVRPRAVVDEPEQVVDRKLHQPDLIVDRLAATTVRVTRRRDVPEPAFSLYCRRVAAQLGVARRRSATARKELSAPTRRRGKSCRRRQADVSTILLLQALAVADNFFLAVWLVQIVLSALSRIVFSQLRAAPLPDGCRAQMPDKVVGDGKRLEQQNGDGRRLGIVADDEDRQRVADETAETDEAGADRVDGERQAGRAVMLSLHRGRLCRDVRQLAVVWTRVPEVADC